MSTTRSRSRNPWVRELNDLVRGASGGFLFGIPLLYTMEVWWIGSFTGPSRMLLVLILTFVAVLLLNRTAGFRRTRDVHLLDAAIDSVEALAIGLICTTATLVLLVEINSTTPLGEALGKIIFESVPFALGVALASQFLHAPNDQEQSAQADRSIQPTNHVQLNATLADVGATLIGTAIVSFSIAPTDEVPMLAAAVSPPWLLAIMAASLLISYGIVFVAGFADQQRRRQQQGIFQRPLSETVMSYLVSLIAAACLLWFFHQLRFDDPWQMWLSHTLILGFPATVGGAAGRLAI